MCFYYIFIFTITNLLLNVNCANVPAELPELNGETFREFIETNPITLNIFKSDDCVGCLELIEKFSRVSKTLNEHSNQTEVIVKFATINLSKEKNLAEKYDVSHAPEILFTHGNSYFQLYDGPLDNLESIIKYIKLYAIKNWMPPKLEVYKLNSENYDEWINQHEICVVGFYLTLSECERCKELAPEFKKAAKLLSSHKDYQIPFGRINCKLEKNISPRYNILEYPAMRIFLNGAIIEYKGNIVGYEIASFILNLIKTSREEL